LKSPRRGCGQKELKEIKNEEGEAGRTAAAKRKNRNILVREFGKLNANGRKEMQGGSCKVKKRKGTIANLHRAKRGKRRAVEN